jgi:ribosomal protein L32
LSHWGLTVIPIVIPVGDSTSRVDPLFDSKSDDARREIANLQAAVADLKRYVEKQGVILRAMFALLCERQHLTEADLLARFQLLETASTSTVVCKQCGRPISLKHNRCLYCGTLRQVESAFELL